MRAMENAAGAIWPMTMTAQTLWCEAVINFHRKNSILTDPS